MREGLRAAHLEVGHESLYVIYALREKGDALMFREVVASALQDVQ